MTRLAAICLSLVLTAFNTEVQAEATTCLATWSQCGGKTWKGPVAGDGAQCCAGAKCTFSNMWYSQCLPVKASALIGCRKANGAIFMSDKLLRMYAEDPTQNMCGPSGCKGCPLVVEGDLQHDASKCLKNDVLDEKCKDCKDPPEKVRCLDGYRLVVEKHRTKKGCRTTRCYPPATTEITCEFTVDNAVDSVWYNNQDISSSVKALSNIARSADAGYMWEKTKQVTVKGVPGAYLVVSGRNREGNACTTGGFQIKCTNGVNSGSGWEAVTAPGTTAITDGRKNGDGNGWSKPCTTTSKFYLFSSAHPDTQSPAWTPTAHKGQYYTLAQAQAKCGNEPTCKAVTCGKRGCSLRAFSNLIASKNPSNPETSYLKVEARKIWATDQNGAAFRYRLHNDNTQCLATWKQCGGSTWKGKGTGSQCCEGSQCHKVDAWYSQCLPIKGWTAAPTGGGAITAVAPKYCSTWGDPHIEQFPGVSGRHKTIHSQTKGTFTLFSYLHPATKQRLSITTVQDKPASSSTRGAAYNTRVTVTMDAHGPNKTIVYQYDAPTQAETISADRIATQSSASAFPAWPRSLRPGNFQKVISFRPASDDDGSGDSLPAPIKLHVNFRQHGKFPYMDVGVEYYGNLSHVDGLCDNSLPPCAEGCSAHEPGVCHCTTPPDLDLTCDVLESCCERAKDPKFPNSPFLGEDYRSCMEDGYHLNGCCEDGANKEDCCAPSIPQDCRIDDYCDCGLGEACNKNTGFCDQKSPRCGPQGTTPSPVTTTAPTTAPAATTAPDAAATTTTPLAPAPSPSPPLPEITTTTTAAPVTDGVATTTAAPLVTTSSSTTLRTWEKWSGDFDEMVFSGGTLEDSQNQLVMAFSINTVGGVQATIRSQQTTHTATGQLTASTDTRCPAQPCARLQYTATTAFVGLVDQQGQDKDQHATIVVAAYTHAGALLGKASATASAPCGSSARALAEKQQQALDALEATMKSIVGPMRAMVAQMKAVDVETATLEDESRRLQAALDQASC